MLWKHSVMTAFGAQHIATAAGLEGNMLFTAGLLHDVGKVVFAGTYGKDYTRLFDPAERDSRTLNERNRSLWLRPRGAWRGLA
jgi:HD-like signal output (HDOD) protein